MKKYLVLVLAGCFVLAMAGIGLGGGPPADFATDTETLTITVGTGVVYIDVYSKTTGAGFSLAQIKAGWAAFTDLHLVEVHSVVDYAVGIDVLNATYLYTAAAGGTSTAPDMDQYRDRLWAEASTMINNKSGMVFTGWRDIDGGGLATDVTLGGQLFHRLWYGSSTAGDASGDRVGVDFKLDLVGQTFPSGSYAVDIQYLVWEL